MFPTLAQFKSWLDCLPETHCFKPRGQCSKTCPIASFLRQTGMPSAVVGYWTWAAKDNPEYWLALPGWAHQFVVIFDRRRQYDKASVLAILEEVSGQAQAA